MIKFSDDFKMTVQVVAAVIGIVIIVGLVLSIGIVVYKAWIEPELVWWFGSFLPEIIEKLKAL